MKRMGMVIGLNPDKIDEYKRLHSAVWPEILAIISECNITNYSIFMKEPENLLFGYWEYTGTDFAAGMLRWRPAQKLWNGGHIAFPARSRWRREKRASGGR